MDDSVFGSGSFCIPFKERMEWAFGMGGFIYEEFGCYVANLALYLGDYLPYDLGLGVSEWRPCVSEEALLDDGYEYFVFWQVTPLYTISVARVR